MTKTELTNAISGAITVVISRTKLLLGISKITDELYPTTYITDTNLTETYTTKSGTDIEYSLKMIKQGNVCRFSVVFRNLQETTLSGNDNIFSFKNNEFKPNSDTLLSFRTNNTNTTLNMLLTGGGVLRVVTPLPPATSFSFSFETYLTQNS